MKTHCPDIVFLMETRLKISDKKAKSIVLCGLLSNWFVIDCNTNSGHRSGGLAVVWNNDVNIYILQANNNFIDMYIMSNNLNISWFATGFYGHPYYA